VSAAKPPVSDTELEVLKVLWAKGPGTVREIEGRLGRRRPRWAYNTVLTLLSRLRGKGYVAADRTGTAHIFRSIVSREELLRNGLRSLADRVCDGTASPLVQALVRGEQFSSTEIAELRKLLDELDSKE
jgi:BlaI family transcriptional regulator, penicillinase repressor